MIESLTIENLELSDVPAVAELYKDFFGEESSVSNMEKALPEIQKDENYLLLGAKIGNQLVGTVTGIICKDLYGDCSPYLLVENFVVHRDFRNKGIGKRLYDRLESHARSRSCSLILLVTEDHREDALRFYSSCGFNKKVGFKKRL